VSAGRKLAHRAEAVNGAARKPAGRLTVNRRLRARGRRDQAKGSTGRPRSLDNRRPGETATRTGCAMPWNDCPAGQAARFRGGVA
jgi:hypothetical protein